MQIDYKKLAGMVGHTNPDSTRNAMTKIWKKLEMKAESADDGEIKEASKRKPAKKNGPKRKAEEGETGGLKVKNEPDSGAENEMPAAKKAKKAAGAAQKKTAGDETKKKAAPKKAVPEDSEDDGELPVAKAPEAKMPLSTNRKQHMMKQQYAAEDVEVTGGK